MASMTIRDLDDDVKARLRVRAAMHGRSMEEEARIILRKAVSGMTGAAFVERMQSLFGKDGVDLDLPPRGGDRPAPDFSDEGA